MMNNRGSILAVAILTIAAFVIVVNAQVAQTGNSTYTNSTYANYTNASATNASAITLSPQVLPPPANLSPLTIQDPYAVIKNVHKTNDTVVSGHVIKIVISDNGASGGTPPYTYQWLESYDNSTLVSATDCGAGNSPSVGNVTPCIIVTTAENFSKGTYLFKLEVTDASGQTVIDSPNGGFTLIVTSLNLSTSIIINHGSSIATGSASGGSGSYIVNWSVTGLTGANAGLVWTSQNYYINSTSTNSNGQTFITNSLNLTKGTIIGRNQNGGAYNLSDGNYTITFAVADANNTADTNSSSALLDVDWFGGINATPSVINSGQSSTVTVKWDTGNTAPFTVKLYSSATSSACENSGQTAPGSGATYVTEQTGISESSRLATFAVSPTSNTFYCAEIIDANGNAEVTTDGSNYYPQYTAYAEVVVNSVSAPTFGVPGITVANSMVDIGQSETIAANVMGGTPPYTFAWTENGNPVLGTSNQITFTGTVVGTNTIVVTVTDHNGATANTLTTITVNPALSLGAPGVTIPDSVIDAGQSEVVSANVVGGTSPYTYSWTENGNPVSGTSNQITFTGKIVGTNTIQVTVTDNTGAHATANGIVTIDPVLAFGTPGVTVPNSVINSGQSELVTANVIGGTGPYTFAWTENGSPVPGTGNSIIFTGTIAGTNTVGVTVTDHTGATANAVGTVTVNSVVSFGTPGVTVPNSVILVGQSETVSANVIGGTGPYTFAWTENGNPVLGTSNQITFTGTVAGTNTIKVVVTDHTGATANAVGTITVNPVLSLGVPGITVPNSVIDLGQSETVTANVIGGMGPYTFAWTENGNSIASNTQSIAFTGTVVGTNTLKVTVTDHTGATANAVGTITVDPALTIGSPGVMVPNSVLDAGQSEIITANVIGGTSPYTFVWTENGNPVPGTVNSITFTGSAAGANTIKVVVTDHAGATANAVGTVTVNPGFIFNSLIALEPTLDVGQNETLVASVIGGTSPYTYNFLVYNNSNVLVANIINAGVSSTSNSFRFEITPAMGTGTFIADAFVTDSASTPETVNDPVVFKVSSTPTLAVTPNTVNIDQGQPVTFNAVVSSFNGTFSWTFVNGTSNTVCGNVISCTYSPQSSGNVVVKVTSNGNSLTTNAIVVLVGNALSVSVNPATASISAGASQTFNASVTGGTGSFRYQWYNTTSGTAVAVPGATANTLTVAGQSAGTFTYDVAVADTGTTGPYIVTSSNAVLTVTGSTSTGGGGGGSTSSGGGGGGGTGGSMLPTVVNNGQCATIYNFTQLDQVNFNLNGKTFVVVENFITPTSAGVSVNNAAYTIYPNTTVTFLQQNGYNYTLELKDIYYIPIQQTITLEVCTNAPVSSGTVATGNSKNSISNINAPAGNALVVSVYPTSVSGEPGTFVILTANAYGGSGIYSYQWYNDSTGNSVAMLDQTHNEIGITLGSNTGTYEYYVRVDDTKYGLGVSSNLTKVVVLPAKATPTQAKPAKATPGVLSAIAGSPAPWLIILLLLLLVIIYVVYRRRKKAREIPMQIQSI